ncbi:MAG: hypothetical protein U9R25_19085 [Chloroflexota bacterium]|nr:hypothetical protein [Chloroflexota bacterium]
MNLRLAWTITGIVALMLLAGSVYLAVRQRGLAETAQPAGMVEAVVESTQSDTDQAIASPPQALGNARNGLIAFVSDRDGNDEIYVMQPDGSDQLRITENEGMDENPFWPSDGSRLIWTRIEDTNDNGVFGDSTDTVSVHSATPDGGDRQLIMQKRGGWVESGGHSQDFTRAAIFFIEDSDENNERNENDQAQLLLFNPNEADLEPVDLLAGRAGISISQAQSNLAILFSNDGNTLFLALDGEDGQGMYAFALDGGPPELLIEGTILDSALSPDGSQLAVFREIEDTGRRRRRLIIYELETGRDTTMLMGGLGFEFLTRMSWHPDGNRLIFMGGTGNSAPDIYSLDIADDELTNLSQRVADPAFVPVWSPDGRQAAFVSQHYTASGRGFVPDGDMLIHLVDDLGSATTQITEDQGNNSQPAWQPVY